MDQENEPKKSNVKTVFIVDDHPIVREGLTEVINREPDLQVVGEAEDAENALRLITALNPSVLIVDINLKGNISGIELIKRLKDAPINSRTLVLSMHAETHFAERSMRAGAMGYVTKQEGSRNLLKAIRAVLNGEVYLCDAISPKLLNKLLHGSVEDSSNIPVDILSDRQLEVFRLIGNGYSTRDIATTLELSISTIESYRAQIKEKLNLKNSAELAKTAVQWAMTNTM